MISKAGLDVCFLILAFCIWVEFYSVELIVSFVFMSLLKLLNC